MKLTRYKTAYEVPYLKDIHVALTDTYFQRTEVIYEIGTPVKNHLNEQVGTIIESNGAYTKIKLLSPVNFTELIELGIPIENIVFDIHTWSTIDIQ